MSQSIDFEYRGQEYRIQVLGGDRGALVLAYRNGVWYRTYDRDTCAEAARLLDDGTEPGPGYVAQG